MVRARHSPPGDASFRISLLKNLGGGALLIVLVAGIFGVIGMVGRADDGGAPPGDTTAEEPPSGSPLGEPDIDTEGQAPPAEDPEPAERDDRATSEPEADPGSAPEEFEEPSQAQPGDAGADAPSGEEIDAADDEPPPDDPPPDDETGDQPDAEASPTVDRSSVVLQVLDGYQADGGSAAAAVATQLRELGYEIIAENPSLRYDVTTVLYTPGNEEAGRQVATDIGAGEVREQPGNLSNDVDVHVVVGADRS